MPMAAATEVNMNLSFQKHKQVDFEELGYQTMLQCGDDEERTKNICALHLHACADQLQPEIAGLQSEIEQNSNHATALHSHLYDRPLPVNDAAMLTHSLKARILFVLTALAAIACFAGNMTTFCLFGFGMLLTLLMAAGTTALPLVVGHLAYERIVAKHKKLQLAVITAAVLLCFAGLYELAAARRIMVDKAASATPVTSSYVDGASAETPANQDQKSSGSSEAKVRQTLGGAILLIMIAADLVLGLLVGLLTRMHTDEDYVAWQSLREITKRIAGLKAAISELFSLIEIAKKRCTVGILRAQAASGKRRIPYHRVLSVVILLTLASASILRAQTAERDEGILIDTSGSISKGGRTNALFQQYLVSTKRLLTTEPPNSRVWVLSIATDSFGGDDTVLKGWTPDSRGVFTDDLNRARRQLASSFEKKAFRLAPVAAGTDIFGALWHFKALFESESKANAARGVPKMIWIFSDMMNETPGFPMPKLLAMGPEQMMERAKANGLMVPMNGYRIYVYGATPSDLTPQAWLAVKNFWMIYFRAAGAELVTYSAECEPQR